MILPELEYTKKLFKKQWPGWNHDWNGESAFHSVSWSFIQEKGLLKSNYLVVCIKSPFLTIIC